MDPDTREQMEETWNVPLMDALFTRRSRRFGLGMEIAHGPNAFKSEQDPIPLSAEEEAMLCIAATGLSGMNLSDMPHTRKEEVSDDEEWDGNANTMLEYSGRTFPSPCGAHGTELFYSNDEGTYIVKMRGLKADKIQEISRLDDLDKLVAVFEDRRIQISDGRIDLPQSFPAFLSLNLWDANKPGSTLFMPVVDVTEELINGMMLNLEQGAYPTDETGAPLGCKKWVDAGLAHIPSPYQSLEPAVCLGATNMEVGFMAQNLLLTESAMGLGGWPFGGFSPLITLGGTPMNRGLSFHFETAESGPMAGFPYAVGKDGLFETHHPHYYGSIDDAVDHIMEKKFGETGIFNPKNSDRAPYKKPGQMEVGVPRTSDDIVQATKDIFNEVIRRYGRFPVFVDPCIMSIMVQAHHLELEFYDKYYKDGAYTERHRRHMEKWHGKKRSRLKAA
ncbi:MAG: hypothetical protein QGI68_06715 [Pseudomonadales bacterium]|jgi:hypothetical protein|nr:hypothetical protein [Pseudomonadales bacterium]MDP7595246.1 hypothetical protein [Pseudomonadales bacterium]HJN49705.1 hypothetical protein [Pseudomonadales bacterium]